MSDENKHKVLFATFDEIPGSNGTSCWSTEAIGELATYLDLDVLSVKGEDQSHIERFRGSRLLRVPLGEGTYLERVNAFQRALTRQLDSEDYHVCQYTSIWEGMVLSGQKKSRGYKLVYQVHSLPSLDFRTTHPQDTRLVETSYSFKQMEDRCFSMADKLLAGSPLIRTHLIHRGVPAKKVELVIPSVNTDAFPAMAVSPGQKNTVAYIGNLLPWQGVPSLLYAIKELPRHMRVRLLIVAPREQPWFSELQGKIQMHGVNRSVELLEPVSFEDLPAVLNRASVCVAPLANHEHNRTAASIPHKVLTYMAARKPVIASHQPALHGLIENGVHGLLYPPGDMPSLTEALQRLLLDGELAKQLGNRARLHLEQKYSLESSLVQIRAIYRKLIGDAFLDEQMRTGHDTIPEMRDQDEPTHVGPEPRVLPVAAESWPSELSAKEPADEQKSAKSLEAEDNQVRQAPENQTPVGGPPPGPPKPEQPKTPASQATEEPEDLIFRSVADEDTASHKVPGNPDTWQVVEATQVRMENSPVLSDDMDDVTEHDRSPPNTSADPVSATSDDQEKPD